MKCYKVRVFLRYFGLDMHNTHSEISKRKYSKVIWEKRLLPHHGHALPKCTSKIQSDYVFSLFFKCRSKKQPEQLKRLKQPGSFSIPLFSFGCFLDFQKKQVKSVKSSRGRFMEIAKSLKSSRGSGDGKKCKKQLSRN